MLTLGDVKAFIAKCEDGEVDDNTEVSIEALGSETYLVIGSDEDLAESESDENDEENEFGEFFHSDGCIKQMIADENDEEEFDEFDEFLDIPTDEDIEQMIANSRLEFDETEKALDLYEKSFQ